MDITFNQAAAAKEILKQWGSAISQAEAVKLSKAVVDEILNGEQNHGPGPTMYELKRIEEFEKQVLEIEAKRRAIANLIQPRSINLQRIRNNRLQGSIHLQTRQPV